MPNRPPLHVPSSVGCAALAELYRVPWEVLAHAYGTGPCGPGLDFDVAAALRSLGDDDALDEAADALFSNICHQGTIYEATAYAVPFLAALVADAGLAAHRIAVLGTLLGSIAVASSYDAPHGSHAGSWGVGVGPLTRDAFRASRGHLAAAAEHNPSLAALVELLLAMVERDAPDPAAAARLEASLVALEAD